MTEIKTLEELNNILTDNKKVLVKIGASWCAPCKMVEKTLEDLEESYPDVVFLKVDCDEADEIVESLDIMSVPVLLYYTDGIVERRNTGSMSKEQIIKLLNKNPAASPIINCLTTLTLYGF